MYNDGKNIVQANRGVFSKLSTSNLKTKNLQVFDSLFAKEANIKIFTDIPLLPFKPTEESHIVNKQFAEGLVQINLSTLLIDIETIGFSILLKTQLNDVYIISNPNQIININNINIKLLLNINNAFCQFKIINTTSYVLEISCHDGAKIISYFFNPIGSIPFNMPGNTQALFTKAEGKLYVAIS